MIAALALALGPALVVWVASLALAPRLSPRAYSATGALVAVGLVPALVALANNGPDVGALVAGALVGLAPVALAAVLVASPFLVAAAVERADARDDARYWQNRENGRQS